MVAVVMVLGDELSIVGQLDVRLTGGRGGATPTLEYPGFSMQGVCILVEE